MYGLLSLHINNVRGDANDLPRRIFCQNCVFRIYIETKMQVLLGLLISWIITILKPYAKGFKIDA